MHTEFIPDEIVPTIHMDLLQHYGGQAGICDRNLLESALTQPKMTNAGKFVHQTIYEKAAAYGYHICMNHPFIDGNKRVAFVLMDIFLQRNNYEIVADEEEAYSMMITRTSGKRSKTQLTVWLKEYSSDYHIVKLPSAAVGLRFNKRNIFFKHKNSFSTLRSDSTQRIADRGYNRLCQC